MIAGTPRQWTAAVFAVQPVVIRPFTVLPLGGALDNNMNYCQFPCGLKRSPSAVLLGAVQLLVGITVAVGEAGGKDAVDVAEIVVAQ